MAKAKTWARTLIETGLVATIDPTAGSIIGLQRVITALSGDEEKQFERDINALDKKLAEISPSESALSTARDLIATRAEDCRLFVEAGEDAGKAANRAVSIRSARLGAGLSEKDKADAKRVLRAYFRIIQDDPKLAEQILRAIRDQQERLIEELGDLKRHIRWISASSSDRALRTNLLRVGTEEAAPSDYLNARYQIVPFFAREEERRTLSAWGDAPVQLSARLVHGAGGQGKTRLAMQVAADARRAGWRAGFLRNDADKASLDALFESADKVLAILDYTEGKSPLIERFIEAASARREADDAIKVRFLILARNAGLWWINLQQAEGDMGRILNQAETIQLEPVAPNRTDRAAMFDRAVQGFSALPEIEPHAALEDRPNLDERANATALEILIAAYAWVRGDSVPYQPKDLLSYAVRRERQYWRRRLPNADELGVESVDLIEFVVVLISVLQGAVDDEGAVLLSTEAIASAKAAGATLPAGSDETRFAKLLTDIYQHPSRDEYGAVDALRPDPIAETLIAEYLLRGDTERERLLTALADERWSDTMLRSTAIVLTRTVDRTDQLPLLDVFAGFVETNPTVRAPLVVDACFEATPRTATALAAGDLLSSDALMLIGDSLPEFDLRLIELSVEVTHSILRRLQEEPKESENLARTKSLALHQLAIYLSYLGRREEALTAIEEAVSNYRDLAAARPDAFLPDLAMSLSVLGDRLDELGRWVEAVARHREAVETLAPLFQSLPVAFAAAISIYAMDYMAACEHAGEQPDETLLGPIEEKLKLLSDAAAESESASD